MQGSWILQQVRYYAMQAAASCRFNDRTCTSMYFQLTLHTLNDSSCLFFRLEVPEQALDGIPLGLGLVVEDGYRVVMYILKSGVGHTQCILLP